ncbi:hypothetical protein SLE2022_220500 [Rubroshorea leprosula]
MKQSSSPGTTPVKLRDCIEELVKFTLHSQINGTLILGSPKISAFLFSKTNQVIPSPVKKRRKSVRIIV